MWWRVGSCTLSALTKRSCTPGMPSTNGQPVVDGIPGVQLRFVKADKVQDPTRHHILDHIGFDVKDHPAFLKKLDAEGIKLDTPINKNPTSGNITTYITDPWGTRIEIIQRGNLGPQVGDVSGDISAGGILVDGRIELD